MSVDITNVSLEEITPLVKNYCDRGSLEGIGMWGIGVTFTGLIRSCHSESRDFELKPKYCVGGRQRNPASAKALRKEELVY